MRKIKIYIVPNGYEKTNKIKEIISDLKDDYFLLETEIIWQDE